MPVYDHHEALPRLVHALRLTGLKCWLVDDGSHAPCAQVVSALCAENQQWLQRLRLEREAFTELCMHPKTQERIVGMLQDGKPVRN